MPELSESREIEAREKAEVTTENTRPGLVFRPDVDILERPDAYVIMADMPGVDVDGVDINLDKGVLTLDAPPGPEPEDLRPLYAEYRTGGYHREFRISEDIDPTQVSATMKNGVLELLLPKSAESRPRRIAVSAG
ncbi:MAG TPA: Hsp20/alpha crystallin family protein [Deltaproteobacteria bacterium]|nr:Hsp20/alpha crystallin family protein [Deltaproteobacteria bacterium]